MSENDPAGLVEGNVNRIIDAAWEASPLAWEWKADPANPTTYADFAPSVLAILMAIQKAIAMVGAEVDDLRRR